MTTVSKNIQIIGSPEDCFRDNIKYLEIQTANALKQLIVERIFDNSAGVDETLFGTYRSESYKKRRVKNNLQVSIKDLQFTEEFKHDLDIGEYEGKTAVGFSTERSSKIVKNQEDEGQIGFPIFSANQEEIDIAFDEIKEDIDRIFNLCLK